MKVGRANPVILVAVFVICVYICLGALSLGMWIRTLP